MLRYISKFVSLSLLYCLAHSSFGQAGIGVGVRTGFQAVAIFPEASYGQRKMDFKIPVRPTIGVASTFWISQRSAFSIDLLFQRMGTRQESTAKRRMFYKDLRLDYIVIPVMYRLTLNSVSGTFAQAARNREPRWYLAGGFQPGFLAGANNTYEVNGNRTDFVSFITEGGNPNFDQIEQNGTPESDEDLYQTLDLSLVGAAGVELYIQQGLRVLIEIRGGLSLTDINAKAWRLPDDNGNYYASRNMFLGVNMAVLFGR